MNPIQVAIGMKEEKIELYQEAVGKCSHPLGRKMFEVILDDEKRHLHHLKQMLAKQYVEVGALSPRAAVRSVVESLRDEMRVTTACTLDELEAFRLAMEKEKAAFEFFSRKAAEASSETERTLFEDLARQEDEHYKVFSETYSFLDDTGNWFMWKEYSIVEG